MQPFALYNLAVYEMNEKNYDSSKQYLNKVNGFKDFDFENDLFVKTKVLLRAIKSEGDKHDKN